MKNKTTKETVPSAEVSKSDADVLAEILGRADAVAMFGDGEVHLSKAQLN